MFVDEFSLTLLTVRSGTRGSESDGSEDSVSEESESEDSVSEESEESPGGTLSSLLPSSPTGDWRCLHLQSDFWYNGSGAEPRRRGSGSGRGLSPPPSPAD